jgi:molybdate transport system regulatory protein
MPVESRFAMISGMPKRSSPQLRVRLVLDAEHALGPGKSDLLDAIAKTGSISAAARSMDMSYKRAWQLVDELNRSFVDVLVATSKGGEHGGGATLTATGRQVLAAYRAIEAKAEAAVAADLHALSAILARARHGGSGN